ncbi:MAG: DUF1318 domain-containing protein [Alphaproteobacteria bacterium]|nr:DUF1318 domain-containing protein [Alphaproteobacteria bacterium]
MKTRFLALILPVFLLIALPVYALDLDSARNQGLVGERLDGYVGVVKDAPGVSALVADINAKRKAEYQKISAKNGKAVDIVGKIAAETIIAKLKPGHYYQGPDGGWKKK